MDLVGRLQVMVIFEFSVKPGFFPGKKEILSEEARSSGQCLFLSITSA